jgi:hypothetical protein
MGAIRRPLPVKLILPMLSADAALLTRAARALEERYGPLDYIGPLLPFEYTLYYQDEFGAHLQRQFLACNKLIDPGELAEIKLWTNALEQAWSVEGKRRINLDPGYLSEAKLVLATTKDFGHRVYIGQGIYAEVTLVYRNRDWRAWPWTYPDYASPPYLEVLRAIRALYMSQVRASK